MLTFDEKSLVVGTADGQMYILQMKSPSLITSNLEIRWQMSQHLEQVQFIHLSTHLEKESQLVDLQHQIASINLASTLVTQTAQYRMQKQAEVLESEQAERMAQLQLESQMKRDRVLHEVDSLEARNERLTQDYEAELQRELQEHENKLNWEINELEKLEKHNRNCQQEAEEWFEQRLEQFRAAFKGLRFQSKVKIEAIQLKFKNLFQDTQVFGATFLERIEQQESQNYMEVEDQIFNMRTEILQIKQVNADIQRSLDRLRLDNEGLKARDAELSASYDAFIKSYEDMVAQNLRTKNHYAVQEQELQQRGGAILVKNEQCQDVDDESHALENLRYLMDQQYHQLQFQKSELVAQLEDGESNLKKMFHELIGQCHSNDKKFLKLQELKMQRSAVRATSAQVALQKQEVAVHYKSIKYQLSLLINSSQVLSPELLKKALQPPLTLQKSTQQLNEELQEHALKIVSGLNLLTEDTMDLKRKKFLTLEQGREENSKVIDECTVLRAQVERYRKFIKNIRKLVEEEKRKRNKAAAHV